MTVTMGALRDAHGAGRLGIHVRTNISKELATRGLGHYPTELPDNQWQSVRVFKNGTPAADLINAVVQPDPKNDQAIRKALDADAQKVLDKIRELIEE
jgi:hypothetical protein